MIFTTAGIGDTLLDSPAILSLAKTYEGIELHAVAHHKRLSLCQHNPYLKKVHPFSKGPLAFPFLYLRLQREGPWDA
ncbi:MAG: hypothetical protein NZL93_04645, partial [Chthoniobacterales bacterium]|nr:hypothetical protein [Chthoniobacterales bacterium]